MIGTLVSVSLAPNNYKYYTTNICTSTNISTLHAHTSTHTHALTTYMHIQPHTHTHTHTHTCGCFFDQLGVPHYTLLDQLHHGLHISRVRTLKGLRTCLGCHGSRTYGLRATMTEGSSTARLVGRDTPLVLTIVRNLNQKRMWLLVISVLWYYMLFPYKGNTTPPFFTKETLCIISII